MKGFEDLPPEQTPEQDRAENLHAEQQMKAFDDNCDREFARREMAYERLFNSPLPPPPID